MCNETACSLKGQSNIYAVVHHSIVETDNLLIFVTRYLTVFF